MPSLSDDLKQLLRAEKEQSETWIRPIVVTRRRGSTDRSGGAIAVGLLIAADRNLEDATSAVRLAVLAHELGHIRLGHTAAMTAAFALLVIYAISSSVNPSTPEWVTFNCATLTLLGALALWATRPAREFEADRYAASIVGREAVARALRWSIGAEPPSSLASRRLAMLEAPALQ